MKQRKVGRPTVEDITESEVVKKITTFDFYPKTPSYVKERTTYGGVVSAIAGLFILILFINEFVLYMNPQPKDYLSVDTTVGGHLNIFINMTFPSITCDDLNLDVLDASGDQQNDVSHNVWKLPVDKEGQILGAEDHYVELDKKLADKPYNAMDDPHSFYYCGLCYRSEWAKILGVRGEECCNTCDAVMKSYINAGADRPPLYAVPQCLPQLYPGNPGCNIFGALKVQKVTGNFHFVPGRSFGHARDTRVHHIHEYHPSMVDRFNASHIIHKLYFGDVYEQTYSGHNPNPLEDTQQITETGRAAVIKYFVKIVPKLYHNGERGAEYSVTRHVNSFKPRESSYMPGVFVIYDLYPIQITHTDGRPPFTHFLVNLCAVVGGLFTVSGFLNKFVGFLFCFTAKKDSSEIVHQ